jgi:hypothetical protein
MYYVLCLCSLARAMTSSFHEVPWLHKTTRQFGRTPLDEWSASRRDLYLTTHNRQKSMPPMGFCFVCFVFVRILCFIVLVLDFSMFFLYRTSLFLECKGRFPPLPPEDAAYWPDTQRTPLAKEGRNYWNLASNFVICRRELGSFTCPKAGTWDRLFYFPSKGRHAVDFSNRKNS